LNVRRRGSSRGGEVEGEELHVTRSAPGGWPQRRTADRGRCRAAAIPDKHPAVRAWLARNPRITLHFTPTSGSWLNLVEVFFSIITRQATRH
jgi:hypothetical protein